MVNKKLKLRGKQKGFAIVTTLIISSVVLVLVGALFYKFSVNGKDIVQDSQRRQALAVAEEASSAYLNFVASKNNPTGLDDVKRKELAEKGASEFLVNANTVFPGYVKAQSGARAGYYKFKSASGKGEFEIKTDALSGGGVAAGYNPIKADIISYVPSKSAGALVRDFNLKLTRTFPPIGVASTPEPEATPTPAEATPTPVAATPTPAGKGDKAGKGSKSNNGKKDQGKSGKSENAGGKGK